MTRRGRWFARHLVAWLLTMGVSSVASAQDAASEARAHFIKGYDLVQRGEMDAAIVEFEQAYTTSPNFAVLYNLGQAYAAVGRSVEAVETLELYLSLGDSSIPESRRAQVREAIAYQSRRIGEIELRVTPAGTRVSLDGRSVGETPLAKPLRATPGPHAVTLEREGFEPRVAVVVVKPKDVAPLSLALVPEPRTTLAITCLLPDASVQVNGQRLEFKLARRLDVPVAPGSHELLFSRQGYVPRRVVRTVTGRGTPAVGCGLQIDTRASRTSKLVVKHPRGTRLLVDGRAHPGQALPSGRHRVSVSGPGHELEELIVSLDPGVERSIEVLTRPSVARLLDERRERERTRRIASYVVGSVGAAGALAALSIFLVNDAAYDDWRSENAQLIARLRTDPESVRPRELDAYLRRENRIRNWDTAAVGLGVFSATTLAGAAALFLWSTPDTSMAVTGTAARWRWQF